MFGYRKFDDKTILFSFMATVTHINTAQKKLLLLDFNVSIFQLFSSIQSDFTGEPISLSYFKDYLFNYTIPLQIVWSKQNLTFSIIIVYSQKDFFAIQLKQQMINSCFKEIKCFKTIKNFLVARLF